MLDHKLSGYIEDVASARPTPGGGNVAGVVNSLGCALMLMSLRIAVLKKDSSDPAALKTEKELMKMKKKSLSLARKDSVCFREVMKSWKKGGSVLQETLKESARVSLDISRTAVSLVSLIEKQDIEKFSNIITDVGISLRLARAAFESGIMNYKINAAGFEKPDEVLEKKAKELSCRFETIFAGLRKTVEAIIN